MFLPDRYIKGECPKCGAKDQYGDACEVCGSVYAPTDLKNPYSTLSGATPVLQVVRALLLPAVRPAVRRLPAAMDRSAPGQRCSPRCRTRRSEWLGDERRRQGPRRLGHLARRALLRHSDPRRAGQVLLRLARRAGRLPRQPQGASRASKGIDFARVPAATRTSSRSTSSARTSSTSTRCSGRRCSKFAGAPYKVPDNVFVHGFLTVARREDVEVARHRHQPRALPRPRARIRSGCATTSPPS